MSEALVELTQASLGHGRAIVLRDVDLAVRPGEFWFVLGDNASGKSTLVRSLLGDLPLLGGSRRQAACLEGRGGIAFVPQSTSIPPHLPTTVREVVSLGLATLGLSRLEARARITEALEHTGLAGLARADYHALSGGQRQRALIARALVRRPGLFLLDEPTAGLDRHGIAELVGLLEGLIKSRAGPAVSEGPELAIVFVTHRRRIVKRHATRLAWCHDGHLETGSVEDILRSDRARDFGEGSAA